MNSSQESTRPLISLALSLGTAFAIMLAFGVTKKLGVLDPEIAKRGAAAALGLVLIVTGNFLPKLRLFVFREDQASVARATERFAGWTFVITGMIFVGSWLLLPLRVAMTVSPLVGVCAFMVVALRWFRLGRRLEVRVEPEAATGRSEIAQPWVGGLVVLQILFGILWAFLVLLADAVWGDRVAQWLAVAYAILISLSLLPLAAIVARARSDSKGSGNNG